MNGTLVGAGILFLGAGAILLALTYLYPESARRNRRRNRSLTLRARESGLRGRYSFPPDPSRSGAAGGYATYEAAGDEDAALYAVVGSKIEGEASFFATEMLWTDARLAWIGVPLVLIGIAASVGSVFL